MGSSSIPLLEVDNAIADEDHFSKIPDVLILRVFRHLDIKTLLRCAQVSNNNDILGQLINRSEVHIAKCRVAVSRATPRSSSNL